MNELQLSQNIEVITAEINAYQRVAGEAIFEIGRRLKHVKENDLAHGEFMKWYQSIGLTKDFVSKAVKITDELQLSRNLYSHLGVEALYLISTIPSSERDKEYRMPEGSVKKLENMTVRQIKDIKKQLIRSRQSTSKKKAIKSGRDKCEICEFDCKAILQIHHIVPVKNGGDNSFENIAILCPNCHSMLHVFLSDKAEKETGLEYVVDWINGNFNSKEIGKIRELWNGMLESKGE